MTKEQAIKELSEMKTEIWADSRQIEAMNVAIHALKALEELSGYELNQMVCVGDLLREVP